MFSRVEVQVFETTAFKTFQNFILYPKSFDSLNYGKMSQHIWRVSVAQKRNQESILPNFCPGLLHK